MDAYDISVITAISDCMFHRDYCSLLEVISATGCCSAPFIEAIESSLICYGLPSVKNQLTWATTIPSDQISTIARTIALDILKVIDVHPSILH